MRGRMCSSSDDGWMVALGALPRSKLCVCTSCGGARGQTHDGVASDLLRDPFLELLCKGIEAMARHIAAQGRGNEKYYIGSARKRLTPEVMRYMIMSAMSSWPAESLIFDLMKGDRFCRHARAFHRNMLSNAE